MKTLPNCTYLKHPKVNLELRRNTKSEEWYEENTDSMFTIEATFPPFDISVTRCFLYSSCCNGPHFTIASFDATATALTHFLPKFLRIRKVGSALP